MPENPVPHPDVPEFESSTLQQIRTHARSSMHAEICGVLIGRATDGVTHVEACIPGEGAAQGGAHVTFTQDAWEHIYKIKDAQFPEQSIVGWYHSHPGFGVFLSDYDLFIHQNFFAAPHQLAWVFDPHSDEEGCFGWVDGKIVPLSRVAVRQHLKESATPRKEEEVVGNEQNQKPEKEAPRSALAQFFEMIVILVCGFVIGVAAAPWIIFHLFQPSREASESASVSAAPTPGKSGDSQPPSPARPQITMSLNPSMPPESARPTPAPAVSGTPPASSPPKPESTPAPLSSSPQN